MSSLLKSTMSKDMDKQLKLAHKVVDLVAAKQKELCDSAAVRCGQTRKFLCSYPNIYKEGGGREVSTSCLSEL